jgi:hypothetical protein
MAHAQKVVQAASPVCGFHFRTQVVLHVILLSINRPAQFIQEAIASWLAMTKARDFTTATISGVFAGNSCSTCRRRGDK